MHFSILDFVDTAYLQSATNYFGDMTGVTGSIFDLDGIPITIEKDRCDFCHSLRSTEEGIRLCVKSDKALMSSALESKKLVFRPCLCAGLLDFCAPILFKNNNIEQVVGFFIGGQLKIGKNISDFLSNIEPKLHRSLLNNLSGHEIDTLLKIYSTGEGYFIETKSDFEKFKKNIENQVLQLSSTINYMYSCRPVSKFLNFKKSIRHCNHIENILEKSLEEILSMVEAKSASILISRKVTKSEDPLSFKSAFSDKECFSEENESKDVLILRKTTYEKLKPYENIGFYQKGEGLTGWVWENKRALNLRDLKSGVSRIPYRNLKWKHKLVDSDIHESFLAVPIIGYDNKSIGVIRVSSKIDSDCFSLEDEIFLRSISDYLSFVIAHFSTENSLKTILGEFGIFPNAFHKLSSSYKNKELFTTIKQLVEEVLKIKSPDKYLSNVRYFINVITDKDCAWSIVETGGKIELKDKYKKQLKTLKFSSENGITGSVIKEHKKFVCYSITESEKYEQYINLVEGHIRSVVCVPIMYEETVSGAIAFISNKSYAFSTEEISLFELIGIIAGYSMRNIVDRTYTYNKLNRYMGHQIRNAISPMNNHLHIIESTIKDIYNHKKYRRSIESTLLDEKLFEILSTVGKTNTILKGSMAIIEAILAFCRTGEEVEIDVKQALKKSLDLTASVENVHLIGIDIVECYEDIDIRITNYIGLFIQTISAILDNSVTAIKKKLNSDEHPDYNEGVIKIEAVVCKDKNKVKIVISDDGIGMTENELLQYRKRYTRVSAEGVDHGIGKEFIADAIERMGGLPSIYTNEKGGITHCIIL